VWLSTVLGPLFLACAKAVTSDAVDGRGAQR
jgi:hypothetical protein